MHEKEKKEGNKMGNYNQEPKIRRKPDLQALKNEIKLIKTPQDIKFFVDKSIFLLPRITNTVARWTKIPPSLQIEPTNACFLNCMTCCRSESTREIGYMDFELFKKIIDDAASIGVKRVLPFVMGEPLMHPLIIEMLRYIKTKGLSFHLITNGLLLTEKMGQAILSSGVTSADYVTFSQLGFSKEVHEKVMRGVDHEKVVNNIHNLITNRKKMCINGPVIETVFYSIAENQHELEPFMDYWGKVVDHAIYGGKAVEAFISQKLPTRPKDRTCIMLWERMAVLWNGDVTICGEDMDGKHLVGNLRESSIQEVWLGEKLRNYKRLHKNGLYNQIPLCEFCDW